jgi:hypothetical protein
MFPEGKHRRKAEEKVEEEEEEGRMIYFQLYNSMGEKNSKSGKNTIE